MDAERLAAVDTTGQHAEVLGLPDHLRDALWRVDSAGLQTTGSAGLVVAGMGGSAIGARLARAVIGRRERRPIVLAAGYELPPWVDESWTVLLSSYSGSTEETLSAWDAASAVGARRIVATTGGPLADRAREAGVPVIPLPGGFQPRAAVGYATVISMEVAAAAGAAPSLRDEVEAAATAVQEAPDPSDLAAAIGDAIPLIIGAELTAPVAYRWKTQVNENANRPAFWNEIPEHDHNEIEGWREPLAPVFLVDPESNPRNLRRFEITAEIARAAGLAPITVTQGGDTRAERLFRLVLLGDLLSIHLAVQDGTDPVAIPALNRVKAELGR
jgi:glucose/mannose-6-phosphate isomerase